MYLIPASFVLLFVELDLSANSRKLVNYWMNYHCIMNVYEVTFIDWLGSDIENKYLHAYIVPFFLFFFILLLFSSLNVAICLAVPESNAMINNVYSYTYATSEILTFSVFWFQKTWRGKKHSGGTSIIEDAGKFRFVVKPSFQAVYCIFI